MGGKSKLPNPPDFRHMKARRVVQLQPKAHHLAPVFDAFSKTHKQMRE